MGSYRERLLVPVSYWLLTVPVVVTLGAEAYFFVDGWIPPLIIGLLAVIVAVFLVHWSAATIEVTAGVLRAGPDTLALSEAGQVLALDDRQAAQLRGPKGDPAAHLLLRPYLRRAVYIGLADPSEGVPYWLIATRHPEELAAAIKQGMQPDNGLTVNGLADHGPADHGRAGDGPADGLAADGPAGDGRAGDHPAGDWESVG